MDSNSLAIPPQYNRLNFFNFSSIVNWSASAILLNRLDYRDDFKFIKIGKLIHRVKDTIKIQEDKEYQRVTIRVQGRGVTERDREIGKNIGTKSQFRVSAGQFIMSKIDARNGAFGIVPKELDGAAVTQDFLAYSFNETLLVPEFFVLLTTTKQFYDLCQRASSGTTNRQRIDEQLFLNFEIPVPSLVEQMKLVKDYNERISDAAKQENNSILLEQKLNQYLENVLDVEKPIINLNKSKISIFNFKELKRWDTDFIFNETFKLKSKYPLMNFGSLFISIRNGIPARDYSNEGIRFLKVTDVKKNNISNRDVKFINNFSYSDIIKPNTLLITRKGTVGQSLFVKEDNLYTASSEIFIIKLNDKIINGEYFAEVNLTSFIQKQYQEKYTGTIMPSMSQSHLMEILIPIPPLEVQKKIVIEVKEIKKQIDNLTSLAQSNRTQAFETFENALFNTKI